MAKIVKCKTCGANIAKTAKICPQCGAKQKKNVALGIFLVIIGVFLFASGIIGFDSSEINNSETQENGTVTLQDNPDPLESADITESEEQKEPENKPTISLSEFNEIATGMTYDEVVLIIGSEGEVLSEADVGVGEEYKTIMYSWKGECSFGANANVTFQGGKVIAKAQLGLK